MARIIPELDAAALEDTTQHRIYQAARDLPKEYTVIYQYKFCNPITGAVIWSADMIIIHEYKGYLVLKVQPGEVGFFNGRWHEFKQGKYWEIPDLMESARSAAYAVARNYKEKVGWGFPLDFSTALCFPGCERVDGQMPPYIKPSNLFLRRDLDNFAAKVGAIFQGMQKRDASVIEKLVDNILLGNFRIYTSLEEQIKSFSVRAQHKFTQEQRRILEETELNRRMVFYGAAGTGKTMLAVEKARRLAEAGKRVGLTCFNRNLGKEFPDGISGLITGHFHGLLENVTGLRPPSDRQEYNHYFEHTLPEAGEKHFSSLPEQQKFDALIVDEGQDFRPHWFKCLEAMVKQDGEFYIFADSHQNIFNVNPAGLEALPASRFRLTTNLRNTASICQRWISPLSGAQVRLGLKDSGEVHFHPWTSDSQQLAMLEKVVEQLLERDIRPRRITILSPNRKEKSCLAGTNSLANCPLGEVGDSRPQALRFSTIRAFKGLEADIVLLIGVRPDSPVSSRPDLYVGGSRARYILHIFHRSDWQL